MGNNPLRQVWLPVATLIIFIAVWQVCCVLFKIDPWLLPEPRSIALKMVEDSALLWKHVLSTLSTALMGTGLGLLIGIIVALVLHNIPFLRTALSPFLVLSQNVPIIALGPLLMIWFGYGLLPKLILLIIVCFFPIALSMLVGLGQAEPQLREYLGMIGASRWDQTKRLEFPASLPYLFSGLRITVIYVVSSAIVAEWLGGGKGIGYYLVLKFKGYDTPAVFGAIVCIVTLSLLFYGAVSLLESIVIRWRPRTVRWRGGTAS